MKLRFFQSDEELSAFDQHLQSVRYAFAVVVAGVTLFFAGDWQAASLPAASKILNAIDQEPDQSLVNEPEVTKEISGEVYRIQPRFSYRISGLVVEEHDSQSWLDISHASWRDHLNTRDLCLLWGANAKSSYLSQWHFSHGDWTCFVETRSAAAWAAFNQDQISNNHILPASAEIAEAIENIQIGDQIELIGRLANYNINGGPSRSSSVVRTDRGNGACEVIYVTGVSVLKRNARAWRICRLLGKFLIVAGIIAMFGFLAAATHAGRRQG